MSNKVAVETFGYPPWKIVAPDGTTYIKVTDFPTPPSAPVSGESMWVKVTSGTDVSGVGRLDNCPVFCRDVACGDLVEYGYGSDGVKPRFLKSIAEAH